MMKILKINPNRPGKEVIDRIISTIKGGGAVIYPTDTVYGLGVNAFDDKAAKKVFEIKGRDFKKPISIMVRDIEMAKRIASFGKDTEKTLKEILPGPITVILFKKAIIPDILTAGSRKIGIRIPGCDFTQILMKNLNFPITTTSANMSGEPASNDIKEILRQFQNNKFKPDLVLNAGILPKSRSSTVIDLTSSRPKVLRAGPVAKKELIKILYAKHL